MRNGREERQSATKQVTTVEQEQLEQLQRIANVGAVASSVAHEFNNILTTILNYAKSGMQSQDPQTVETAFDKILNSARRAAKITTGILALSRNRTARHEPTDVVRLVEEVLCLLEKDLSKYQISMRRDYPDEAWADLVTPQIEQVLMNIVINARQAMTGGGELRVKVVKNEHTGMIEIGVRDTGPGMEPDELNRIFDPFYSTKDGPDESGHGGSGLGLSICREIIERHNGRIRVESVPGKGTTFIVKLPACPPSD